MWRRAIRISVRDNPGPCSFRPPLHAGGMIHQESTRTLLSACPGWTTPHYRPRLLGTPSRQGGLVVFLLFASPGRRGPKPPFQRPPLPTVPIDTKTKRFPAARAASWTAPMVPSGSPFERTNHEEGREVTMGLRSPPPSRPPEVWDPFQHSSWEANRPQAFSWKRRWNPGAKSFPVLNVFHMGGLVESTLRYGAPTNYLRFEDGWGGCQGGPTTFSGYGWSPTRYSYVVV